MKITPDVGGGWPEGSVCDTDRMAQILQDLLIGLADHREHRKVPEAFSAELENVIFAGMQLRQMIAALKAEFYIAYERNEIKSAA